MHDIIKEDINWLIQHTNWELFRNKKILVTGASGSIARYVVFYFMALNKSKDFECYIYALVRNQEKAKQIFGDYLDHPLFHLIIGNVGEKLDYADGMNFIFHAAGISTSKFFSMNTVEIMRTNLIGTYYLLDRVITNQQQKLDKFIFFSSGAVYGKLPNLENSVNESTFFTLDALNDNGVYAESKRSGELLCYSYWREHQLPVVMARIGHTYGPGIDLNDGHIYSELVNKIISRQPVIIRNPLDKRPFTYVRDTVYGLILLALSGEDGNAYNLWNADEMISIGKLTHILFKEVFKDRNLQVFYEGMLYKYDNQMKENIYIKRTDTQKLETLGWKALVDVAEGFYRTVKSFE